MSTHKGRTYKDFPDIYFQLLEQMSKPKAKVVVDLNFRSASSMRRDLYRFFAAIRIAMDEGDQYAEHLFSIHRNMQISLLPSRAGPDEPAKLTFSRNPLADALLEAQKGENADSATGFEAPSEETDTTTKGESPTAPEPDTRAKEEADPEDVFDLSQLDDVVAELEGSDEGDESDDNH